jgi:hypothetical protein
MLKSRLDKIVSLQCVMGNCELTVRDGTLPFVIKRPLTHDSELIGHVLFVFKPNGIININV